MPEIVFLTAFVTLPSHRSADPEIGDTEMNFTGLKKQVNSFDDVRPRIAGVALILLLLGGNAIFGNENSNFDQDALTAVNANPATVYTQTNGNELVSADSDEPDRVVFQKMKDGLPILGNVVTVYFDVNGDVIRIEDDSTENLKTGQRQPQLDATVAIEVAESTLTTLKALESARELVWFRMRDSATLAWQIDTKLAVSDAPASPTDLHTTVDAATGMILSQSQSDTKNYEADPVTGTGVFPRRIVINDAVGPSGAQSFALDYPEVCRTVLGTSCTATLIAPNVVISARHCGSSSPGAQVRFGPSSISPFFTTTVASSILPAGPGSTLDGGDVAILILNANVPASVATPMRFIDETSSLVGMTAATVGYGANGVGSTGHMGTADGLRWGGENVIDVYGSPASSSGSNIISTDFDDGTAASNTISGSDPIPLANEATTAPGDSGGPIIVTVAGEFLIAGVLSAGTTDTSVYGDISWWTGTANFRSQIEAQGGTFASHDLDIWIDADADFSFFDVIAKWQDLSPPLTSSESASFSLPGSYEVWWDFQTGDITNFQMRVAGGGEATLRSFGSGGGSDVFTYTASDLILVDNNAELNVGEEDGEDPDRHNLTTNGLFQLEGLMTVNSGSIVTANQMLVTAAGSPGLPSLFVQDATSALIVNEDFTVAPSGNAIIIFRDESSVDVGGNAFFGTGDTTGAPENATVAIASGAGLTVVGLMDIGSTSTAFMNVFGGSTVSVDSEVYIGAFPGAEGELIVRDSGTTFSTTGVLFTGWQGDGIFRIENGGVVSSSDIVIGDEPSGTGMATVTGNNSLLSVTGDIQVGNEGTGTLIINDGADATAGGLVAILPGSTVMMTSEETDVLSLTGAFGLVNAGELSFEAPAPDINGDLRNDSQIISKEPSIPFFNDNFVNNGTVFIEFVSAVRIFGSASGSGAYTGPGTIDFHGDVQPGDGSGIGDVGVINISGNLELTSPAVTQIEISDTNPNFFDRLLVDGDVEASGSLIVTDLGHDFSVGDEFVFIEVGGNRTGMFDGLPEGAFVREVDGLDLLITYTAGDGNDIAVFVVEGGILLGDVNLDGVVNLLDIAPFVALISSGEFQAEADINGDGEVTLLDIAGFVDLLAG